MTRLRVCEATKRYGDGDTTETVDVFTGLNLSVDADEFVTLMGPSGCGKTTILNIIAGLTPLTEGTVEFDDKPVVAGEFPFGYVFQEPRLLDWRTVGKNIEFVLRSADINASEFDSRIDSVLTRVGLADERDSYPQRLSGGQRQRVNLARALAIEPELLLMDEPFSSLDEVTARHARQDLLDVWYNTQKAVLFVTHDMGEAVALSDRILFIDTEGNLFDEIIIDHERPRDFDDPALRETEAQLTRRFFRSLQ
ncbi:MAG: ABC-type nitrate/sulfonate/bicarbonate transport system, ATPase component [Haloquadratum walsbyi J07HQW1]|jgi:NitT/TauT family transport system ATP-binding protein|nr:MAG: ABC-type nitrate/sulfonate/bicarbonate transport system, ATPase component [Haloquadratum walsbyi J07HQW1]